MINKEVLASYITQTLNNNTYNIVFDVKVDRNEYENAKLKTQEFVVPGVLLTGTGTREPTTTVDIYYQNLNVELFAYACLDSEGVRPPFDYEQQVATVENLTTLLNAQVKGGAFFEDEDGSNLQAFFNTSTVTVGGVTNASGGGYTRIPLLWQVEMTVVKGTTFFNDIERSLTMPNGQKRVFMSLNPALTKTTNRNVFTNSVINKSLNESKKRVFTGTLWYQKNDNLFAEEFVGDNLNTEYTVNFDNHLFTCIITSLTAGGADGGVVSMDITLEEVQDER